MAPRRYFWCNVDRRLAALALPAAEREGVEAALLSVVPRPTPEEIAAGEQELLRATEEIRKALA